MDNSLDEGGKVGEDAPNGKVREAMLKRFRQSVSDRVSRPDRAAVRPMTIAPGPQTGGLARAKASRRSSSASAKFSRHRTSGAGFLERGDHPPLSGNLVARILTASRDGLGMKVTEVERVAQTVRNTRQEG